MSEIQHKKMPQPNPIGYGNYRDEYGTPDQIWQPLRPFDIDVAASQTSRIGVKNWTKEDDGLSKPWDGFWFCNPPFSKKAEFLQKAYDFPNGIMLLPMSTDTKWFQEMVSKSGHVFFFGTRIHYIGASGPAIFQSGLIPFGDEAVRRIQAAKLRGIMMKTS